MIPINIQNIVVNTPPTKITSQCAKPFPLEISIRTTMLTNILTKVNNPLPMNISTGVAGESNKTLKVFFSFSSAIIMEGTYIPTRTTKKRSPNIRAKPSGILGISLSYI